MFFDSIQGLFRVSLASVAAYVWLILVLRAAGKRSLAKLNAFDLVVTVALGSTLATVLLSKDVALAEGLLALAVLALLQWVVSKMSVSWRGFGRLVRSRPRMLLEDGRYCEEALTAERITRSEVDAAVRSSGIGSLEEVAAVVLESDGTLSVIRSGDKPLTALRSVQR